MMAAMTDDHWGEAAVRAARARNRRQAVWMLAGAAAFWLFVPAAAKLFDHATGAPDGAHRTLAALLAVIGAIGVAALGSRRYMASADEVERRVLIDAYAAFGAIMFFGFPIVNAGAAVFAMPYLHTALFITAVLAASGMREWRRRRG